MRNSWKRVSYAYLPVTEEKHTTPPPHVKMRQEEEKSKPAMEAGLLDTHRSYG